MISQRTFPALPLTYRSRYHGGIYELETSRGNARIEPAVQGFRVFIGTFLVGNFAGITVAVNAAITELLDRANVPHVHSKRSLRKVELDAMDIPTLAAREGVVNVRRGLKDPTLRHRAQSEWLRIQKIKEARGAEAKNDSDCSL